MKNSLFIYSAFLLLAITSTSSAQVRQTKLYIDDGSGNFTVLHAASGGGDDTVPAGGGSFVVESGTGAAGQVLTYRAPLITYSHLHFCTSRLLLRVSVA
jgi:hypothetical protein